MYFAINLQVFGRNFRTLFRNCRILCFWRSAQFFGQKIQKLQNLKLFLEINIKLLSFLYTIFVCNGSKIMEFHGFFFQKISKCFAQSSEICSKYMEEGSALLLFHV